MKKKLFSIALIVVLISFTVAPLWGYSCISYGADVSENLSDVEKMQAGLVVYLNDRGGYLTGDTDTDINVIKEVMNSFINSYEFWKNDPVISKATLLAGIIIKYSPFRISLKGSAIRAYNDLFNYLKEKGYFSNAVDNSNVGDNTIDNVYSGYSIYNQIMYVANENATYHGPCYVADAADVNVGMPIGGITPEYVKEFVETNNSNFSFGQSNSNAYLGDLTFTYNNIYAESLPLRYYASSNSVFSDYCPLICGSRNSSYSDTLGQLGNTISLGFYGSKCYANSCYYHIQSESSNTFHCGYVAYSEITGQYFFRNVHQFTRSNSGTNIPSVSVDFETIDFNKNDLVEPDPDEEVEFIPVDSDTGDTFNTYNEYVENYVIKKTIINKENEPDPDPDPTPTPGGGSGTITPDGNGGYTFNLPDFEFPDLSNLNFNLSGLSEKFPFSIPFDLLAFFTVLNAPPETPELQGDINLGIVHWNIDWDLHDFDNLAALLRTLEFIGFCIALALITRSIIKG